MIPFLLALGVGAVAAFGIRVATRPPAFRVERSAFIDAPPERIYPLLDDFREWRRWSPWEKLDPNLQRVYEGSPRGRGAIYSWAGNRKAGKGRMEITEADPPRRISLNLEFIEPFRSQNVTEFVLTPREGGTDVLWAMHGPNTFSTKVMQSVVSMDRLVGGDFERGLESLRVAATG